ncbi:hypothetical protein AURDEDRAFT_171210 [Auricularia subglabra TFB-10046 SS5]|uniref:Uncharacterized protein n=1 Tax=Auricularia subglabra (strain TFB-10046 / SS5) TaxID=717982 RepID=J0D1P8_AURST|nr:hypothetical protein AURDEDRAFT_171210 [Auricularia subglabra TFB-10046 SS5]
MSLLWQAYRRAWPRLQKPQPGESFSEYAHRMREAYMNDKAVLEYWEEIDFYYALRALCSRSLWPAFEEHWNLRNPEVPGEGYYARRQRRSDAYKAYARGLSRAERATRKRVLALEVLKDLLYETADL